MGESPARLKRSSAPERRRDARSLRITAKNVGRIADAVTSTVTVLAHGTEWPGAIGGKSALLARSVSRSAAAALKETMPSLQTGQASRSHSM